MSLDGDDDDADGVPPTALASSSKSIREAEVDVAAAGEGEGLTAHAAKMSPGAFLSALVYAIIILKRKAKKIIRRRREKRSRVKSKLRDTIARSNRQVKDASFGRQIMRPSSAQPQRQELPNDTGNNELLRNLSPNRPGVASKPFSSAIDVSAVLDHKVIAQSKARAKQIVDRIKLMSPSDLLGNDHFIVLSLHTVPINGLDSF
jgi:hypothetical protein